MRWHVRVISGLTVDTEPSIEVSLEDTSSKYLFNCGEGLTRACIEHKRSLRKVKGVFLTRLNTQQSGGLAGLIMSLADNGVPEVQIHGPTGLMHLVASMRHYSRREIMSVSVNEIHAKLPESDLPSVPDFTDGHLCIYAVPIQPSTTTPPLSPSMSSTSEASTSSRKRKRDLSPTTPSKRSNDGNNSPSDDFQSSSKMTTPPPFDSLPTNFTPSQLRDDTADLWRHRVVQSMFKPPGIDEVTEAIEEPAQTSIPTLDATSNFSMHSWKRLPPTIRSELAVSYVGIGPSVRGKFDAQKAKELGLPNGPIRARLARGETVTTPNGVTITPDMCVGPSIPPAGFIFIDCPGPAYVPGIISSPSFDARRYGENVTIHFIIHRAGPNVLEDERYREWMSDFGPHVHHIFASELYTPNNVVFNSSAHNQLMLSTLDADIFRCPQASTQPQKALSSVRGLPPLTHTIQPDMIINMIPTTAPQQATYGLQDKYYPLLDSLESSTFQHPFSEDYLTAQKLVKDAETSHHPFPGSDILITTLGTGSALPSKYRNVSATLVQIPRWGNILLDGGEGTWGQLARRFGVANPEGHQDEPDAFSILRDLRCIFLSHIHGDHHMGISRLLAKRQTLNLPPTKTLTIIGNSNTLQYLHEYDELEDIGLTSDPSVQTLDSQYLLSGATAPAEIRAEVLARLEALNNSLGLKEFKTIEVIHRSKCFGCVIRHVDGWSIVFSGDTMPCDRLINAGKGATLLIHEATMADDEADLAVVKAHSTFGQAVGVGRRMNAQNILLTHFSQRYPKIPVLPINAPAETPDLRELPVAPVALAFDCATMPIGSMWKLEYYTGAITKTFESTNDMAENADVVASELLLANTVKVEPNSKVKRGKHVKA